MEIWSWKNNKELIPLYKGGIKLDPLIGISIGVDLIPLIQFIPGVGKIIDWILDVVQYLSDSKIYIIFECFTAVKAELSLSYNKIDGFDNKAEQKAEVEADLRRIRGSNISGMNNYREENSGYSDINSADRRLADRHQGIRDIMTIALLWPDISLAFSWKLEETLENDDHINKVGTLLKASLVANPLIGLTLTLDFLALIQRAHPVASAVIAVADITLELFGDGSRIEVSLSSTRKLSADVGGFVNLTTGENTFNRESLEGTNRKIAKASGDLAFKLTIGLFLVAERRVFLVKVVGELSASVEAEAKFRADFALKADSQGFYVEPTMRFDGLEIIGQGTARVEVKGRKPESSYGSAAATGNFKYTAMKKSSSILEPWSSINNKYEKYISRFFNCDGNSLRSN